MSCRLCLGTSMPSVARLNIAILFTTLIAVALIVFVGAVPALGGTTALLLLCVFAIVNIAVLVLRKDKVEHKHFRTPTFVRCLAPSPVCFSLARGRAVIPCNT